MGLIWHSGGGGAGRGHNEPLVPPPSRLPQQVAPLPLALTSPPPPTPPVLPPSSFPMPLPPLPCPVLHSPPSLVPLSSLFYSVLPFPLSTPSWYVTLLFCFSFCLLPLVLPPLHLAYLHFSTLSYLSFSASVVLLPPSTHPHPCTFFFYHTLPHPCRLVSIIQTLSPSRNGRSVAA